MTAPTSEPVSGPFEVLRKSVKTVRKSILRPWRRWKALRALRAYDRSLAALPLLPRSCGMENDKGGIYTVYFSCHRDFAMISMSLQSLLACATERVRRIFIYEDGSNPFTQHEQDALRATSDKVTILTGPRVSGWGINTLIAELNFFRQTLQETADASPRWMVKLDSDVLFLNDAMFAALDDFDGDLFGNPYTHDCGFTYSQGGCYAIGTNFLLALVSSPVAEAMCEVSELMRMPINHMPEDASIFYLAKRLGGRVRFRDYYLSASLIPTFNPAEPAPASVIHFEGCFGPQVRLHMDRIARLQRAA